MWRRILLIVTNQTGYEQHLLEQIWDSGMHASRWSLGTPHTCTTVFISLGYLIIVQNR
jgi:hypothetical protein